MAVFVWIPPSTGGGSSLPEGTAGDLLTYDGDTNAWTSLPLGTSGYYLRVSTSDPTSNWVDLDTQLATLQPLDADLTALAALSTAGVVVRTGAGAFSPRTLTSSSAALTITNGTGASGNPTFDLDADLTAIAALSTTGLVARTGTSTWTPRAIEVTDGLVITNGDGVAGNPTIDLGAHLFTLATNAGVGLWVAGTGADVVRSLAVGTGLTVTNPTGAGGDPTVGLGTTLAAIVGGTWAGASSITTVGSISTGTWNGTTIAVAKGGTGGTDAATARTNMGLAIGTDVQAYSLALTELSAAYNTTTNLLALDQFAAGNTVALVLNTLSVSPVLRSSGTNNSATAGAPELLLDHVSASGALRAIRTRALGTSGSKTTVVSGTVLGYDEWWGYNGTDHQLSVRQDVSVDGALVGGLAPGRIVWSLVNSSGVYGERMRLNGAALTMAVPIAFTNAPDAASTFSAIKQDATTSATGVVELATGAEYAAGKVPDTADHRWIYAFPADKVGARIPALNGTAIGTGILGGITQITAPARAYITGYGHIDSNTTSTTLDRGWYLTPSTNSHLTMDKLTGSRISAQMACPSDNGRYFVFFAETGVATTAPTNGAIATRRIVLGVYNNVFTWAVADGSNEATGSLTVTGHTAGTVYDFEIIWTSSSSVTFNIYNADRSALLETHTRTTTIPTGTTQCFIGQACRTASTTPTWYYGAARLRLP